MQSQFVKSRRPKPFWQVLAVVGAYCISKKFEPGNLDPEKMTLTRKVVLVPGEGEHKVGPDTLAIILASKRTINV